MCYLYCAYVGLLFNVKRVYIYFYYDFVMKQLFVCYELNWKIWDKIIPYTLVIDTPFHLTNLKMTLLANLWIITTNYDIITIINFQYINY